MPEGCNLQRRLRLCGLCTGSHWVPSPQPPCPGDHFDQPAPPPPGPAHTHTYYTRPKDTSCSCCSTPRVPRDHLHKYRVEREHLGHAEQPSERDGPIAASKSAENVADARAAAVFSGRTKPPFFGVHPKRHESEHDGPESALALQ